jgi:hypothetical protein
MSTYKDEAKYEPRSAVSGKAIASLILGIVSFCIPLLPTIAGIILGILGLNDIERSQRSRRLRLTGGGLAIAGIVLSVLGLLAQGAMIALLLPAVQKVRAATMRIKSTNNLQRLALAMHHYHDQAGTFPTAAVFDRRGKPLYSWRVVVLPYMGEQLLYQRFKPNERWDGTTNGPLLSGMPPVYLPITGQSPEPFSTYYQVIVGKGAAFEGRRGMRVTEFVDGTSNTILIVEGGDAVPWTKPADVVYDPAGPLPRFGGMNYHDGFMAAMADGSVRPISNKISEQTLRAAITRNGGEVLGPDF